MTKIQTRQGSVIMEYDDAPNVGAQLYNMNLANTARIREALRRMRAGEADVIVLDTGPSTVAGQTTQGLNNPGGTVQASISPAYTTAAQLDQSIYPSRADNLTADHGGFGQAQNAANYMAGDGRVTLTGAFAPGSEQTIGGNAFGAAAAGRLSFTPDQPFDGIEIIWRDASAGRSFSVSSGQGSYAVSTQINSTGGAGGVKTAIPMARALNEPINVDWVAGSITLNMIRPYLTTKRSIHFINAGISGATTAQLVNDTNTTGRIKMLSVVQPALVIIQDWPINDWRTGVDIPTCKANITNYVVMCKAAGADVLLVDPPYDSGVAGNSAQQDSYAQMLEEVSNENNVPLLRLRRAMVSYANEVANNWVSDSVHPANGGYRKIGRVRTHYFTALPYVQ